MKLLVTFASLVVIAPTNKRRLSPQLDKRSEEARRLMQGWNRLHGVRTILSIVALVIFLLNA